MRSRNKIAFEISATTRSSRTAAACCLLVVSLAGCAKGVMPDPDAKNTAQPADGQLDLQSPVPPPYAFTHFCLDYADECRVHEASFNDAADSDIADVNNEVNRTISPHGDKIRIGFGTWRIAPPSGDCNDYAVTKRHQLLDRGWPSRSLLLAEVITRQGEHHLVLVVRSERRDVVLDNLTSAIQDWSATPYEWVRVQSPDDPQSWLSVARA
jgi:predicted transglutaminase-like cysteine proteinase